MKKKNGANYRGLHDDLKKSYSKSKLEFLQHAFIKTVYIFKSILMILSESFVSIALTTSLIVSKKSKTRINSPLNAHVILEQPLSLISIFLLLLLFFRRMFYYNYLPFRREHEA